MTQPAGEKDPKQDPPSPPTPPDPPTPPTPPDPSTDEDPNGWDKERAANTIKAQREAEKALKTANAEMKKRLDALEAEKKEREDAELTELERLRKENEEATAKLVEQTRQMQAIQLDSAIRTALGSHEVVDTDTVTVLLDKTNLSNEDGTPNTDEIEKSIKALLKEKPFLLKSKSGPPSTPNASTGNMSEEQAKAASERVAEMTRTKF